MTIYSTLTILMYALEPFALWLNIGTTVLIALYFVAYLRGYQMTQYRCYFALTVAGLVGLSAMFWIPPLTHSQLSYVSTWVDWTALVIAMVGIAILTFLVLHPLTFLVRDKA